MPPTGGPIMVDGLLHHHMQEAPLGGERLLVGVRHVARMLGVSRNTVWKLNASGRMPSPIRLGRRTLWVITELEAWVAAGCPPRHKWQAIREGGGR